MHAVCKSDTGKIVRFTRTGAVLSGEVSHPVTGDLLLEAEYYYPSGVRTARPSAAPIPTSGTAPMTLDPAIFPAGSLVTLRNEAGQEFTDIDPTDTNDPIVLTDAGVYQVSLTAPFPERSIEVEITVA